MKTDRKGSAPGSLGAMVAQIRRPVITDRDEEHRLVALAQKGDAAAMRHLLGANVGIILRYAHKYLRHGREMEDLFVLGLAALNEGVMRYEPSVGTRLMTYASWWIRAFMKRGTAHDGRAIYIPDRVFKMQRKAAQAERSLCGGSSESPTTAEVAAAIGMKPERLAEIREVVESTTTVSLETPVGTQGDATLGDLYQPPDAGSSNALSLLLERRNAEALHRAMDTVLTPVERAVIEERFFNEKTLKETGELIAPHTGARTPVSRERARQLEEQAIKKLAKALASIKPDST